MPLFYLLWSWKYGRDAGSNPWKATGLEWRTSSPPLENAIEFGQLPVRPSSLRTGKEGSSAKSPSALELGEQFSTPDQQRQTAMVGMWVFLISEVLLFGALFTAFTVYRMSDPQAFDLGAKTWMLSSDR